MDSVLEMLRETQNENEFLKLKLTTSDAQVRDLTRQMQELGLAIKVIFHSAKASEV